MNLLENVCCWLSKCEFDCIVSCEWGYTQTKFWQSTNSHWNLTFLNKICDKYYNNNYNALQTVVKKRDEISFFKHVFYLPFMLAKFTTLKKCNFVLNHQKKIFFVYFVLVLSIIFNIGHAICWRLPIKLQKVKHVRAQKSFTKTENRCNICRVVNSILIFPFLLCPKFVIFFTHF